MVSTLLILAVAAVALFASSSLLFPSRRQEVLTAADWERKKWDIDVSVLRLLLDGHEEHYLVSALPAGRFSGFQRRRVRVALQMVRLARENTEMLMGLGGRVRVHGDRAAIQEADQLMVAAMRLQVSLFLATVCLWVRWVFPRLSVSVPSLELSYQRLLDSLIRVQRHSWQG